MITIADTIAPERVKLALAATEPAPAIREAADLLHTAPEVLEWDALLPVLLRATPCLSEKGSDFGICLPHARTEAVSTMVMSIGRAPNGIRFPECVVPVRYIFCIGVPQALANDYLRIVGLLARILKSRAAEAQLRTAKSGDDFIAALARLERAI